jgi:hypothetical protein
MPYMHLIRHEYGPMENTMDLIKSVPKCWCINCLENYYIQMYQNQGKLIKESPYVIKYDIQL